MQEETDKEVKMITCKVEGRFRHNGILHEKDTTAEFDSEAVDLYPKILFPIGKDIELKHELKETILKTQEEVSKLNNEIIQLKFKIEEKANTINLLTAINKEKVATLKKQGITMRELRAEIGLQKQALNNKKK